MEGLVLEPKAERIARYKAERRRQLAERYGVPEELPPKHVRRETGEVPESNGDGSGGTAEVPEGNGCHPAADPSPSDRPCPNASAGRTPGSPASVLGGGGPSPDAATGLASGARQLRTRVSVGQLKSALLQQTCSGTPAEQTVDDGCVAATLDLAVKPGSGGRRRPRRYLPGGGAAGGRKTSERFRTQPITAGEMEESSGMDEAEKLAADVKTDDRAKMSVAAKMSLFKELEKNASPEISSFLRPRSGVGVQDRRARRAAEQRALTQPVTSEEMVVAASQPRSSTAGESADSSPVGAKPEEEDESSKLTLGEKLALFTKLAQPDGKAGVPHEAADKRRQKGARYRTQPITLDEVDLLQRGPVQLPPLHLSAQLHGRQQGLSVNLRPSEVRETQALPGRVPEESGPLGTPLQPLTCEPREIKGILKKAELHKGVKVVPEDKQLEEGDGAKREAGRDVKPPVVAEKDGNNRLETPVEVREDVRGAARRSRSLHGAPWRHRGRSGSSVLREDPSSEPGRPPRGERLKEGRDVDGNTEGIVSSSAGNRSAERCDDDGRQRSGMLGEGLVEEPPAEHCCKARDSRRNEAEDDVSHDASVCTLCWEPVLSSVFAPVNSASQYVISYNQATLSYEAQEVSSPTQGDSQTPWRQKNPWAEPETRVQMEGDAQSPAERIQAPQEQEEQRKVEREGAAGDALQFAASGRVTEREVSNYHDAEAQVDRKLNKTESLLDNPESKGPSVKVTAELSREVTTLGGEGTLGCFDVVVTSSVVTSSISVDVEQDLGTIFQASAPKLTSAVAEHRRSVRPARKVQGSRNPLRALAARDDLRQEYVEQQPDVERTGLEQENALSEQRNTADATPKDSGHLSSNGTLPISDLALIHVKGHRRIQVRLVEPAARSLNSGDCFLLVTPGLCCVWNGEFSSAAERAKALEVASSVQSGRDMGCRAAEVTVLEGDVRSEDGRAAEFWSLLGGSTGCRGGGDQEEDEAFESGVVESNCVYRLAEDRLLPVEEAWASTPSVALLGSTEALVFDFGGEVYVWHGQEVCPRDRKMALQLGRQVWAGPYDYSNCRVNPLDPSDCNPEVHRRGERRPGWTLFGCLSEHGETALFKAKFLDWPVRADPRVELQPCDAKALLAGGSKVPRTVLEGVDVNRGCGPVAMGDGQQGELSTVGVDTWHVLDSDEQPLPPQSSGQLYEGDAYAVLWRYTVDNVAGKTQHPGRPMVGDPVRERSVRFLWRGRRRAIHGSRASAFATAELRSRTGPRVPVVQGEEPPCFLRLFQGGLVIHRGSRQGNGTGAAPARLFCVGGEVPEEAWLLETECRCASLRSRGSLVLWAACAGAVYLWHGCKAHAGAREVGRRAARRLVENCPSEVGLSGTSSVAVQEVEEGAEPAQFWDALGVADRKAYDCMLQDPGRYSFTPRLFRLSTRSGVFQGEELLSPTRVEGAVTAMPFLQETLYGVPQPALFLLDNRMEVYLWQGPQLGDTGGAGSARAHWDAERRCAMETTLRYCKERNPRRPPQAYLIFAGSEPLTFTNIFPCWDRDSGTEPEGEAPRGKVMLVKDALERLAEAQTGGSPAPGDRSL